jgi:hypothetical protein
MRKQKHDRILHTTLRSALHIACKQSHLERQCDTQCFPNLEKEQDELCVMESEQGEGLGSCDTRQKSLACKASFGSKIPW